MADNVHRVNELAAVACQNHLAGTDSVTNLWIPLTMIVALIVAGVTLLLLTFRSKRKKETWRIADRFRALGIEVDEYPFGLPCKMHALYVGLIMDKYNDARDSHPREHSYVVIPSRDGNPEPHAICCVTCHSLAISLIGDNRSAFATMGPVDPGLEGMLRWLELGGTKPRGSDPTALERFHARLRSFAPGNENLTPQSYREHPIFAAPKVRRPKFFDTPLLAACCIAVSFLFMSVMAMNISEQRRAVPLRILEGFAQRFSLGNIHCSEDNGFFFPLFGEIRSMETPQVSLWKPAKPVPDFVYAGNGEHHFYGYATVAANPRVVHRCPKCAAPSVLVDIERYRRSDTRCGIAWNVCKLTEKTRLGTACARKGDTPLEAFARRLQPYGVTIRRGPARAAACHVGSVTLERWGECPRCNSKELYLIAEAVLAGTSGLVDERSRGKACLVCGSWMWPGPEANDAGFFGGFTRGDCANMFDTLDLLEAGECGRNEARLQLLRRLEGRLEHHLAYVRMVLARSDRAPISRLSCLPISSLSSPSSFRRGGPIGGGGS